MEKKVCAGIHIFCGLPSDECLLAPRESARGKTNDMSTVFPCSHSTARVRYVMLAEISRLVYSSMDPCFGFCA